MDADREDTLADSFWSLARQLRHLSRTSLEPLNISPSQSRAVIVLMRHGEMRLSELSDHLRIAARSATEVVDALQERGFLLRRPDPADRRATLVALTEQGWQAGAAIREARAKQTAEFFEVLSPADRADLARILRRLGA